MVSLGLSLLLICGICTTSAFFERAVEKRDANVCCQNGGHSVVLSDGSQICKCNAPFYGDSCEKDASKCPAECNVCKNGGALSTSSDAITCTCPTGFSGLLCDNSVGPPPVTTPAPPPVTTAAPPPTTTAAPRRFYLYNAYTNHVADILNGNPAPGAALVTHPHNIPNTINQQWYLDGNGYIKSALNNLPFANAAFDTNLSMQNVTGPRAQWTVVGNTVQNGVGECADILNWGKADFTPIISFSCRPTQGNQIWAVQYV